MPRVVIPLGPLYARNLQRIAAQEYRDPRMQAKLLLEAAINERAGTLPAKTPRAETPTVKAGE